MTVGDTVVYRGGVPEGGVPRVVYRAQVLLPGYTVHPPAAPASRASSPAHAEVARREALPKTSLPSLGKEESLGNSAQSRHSSLGGIHHVLRARVVTTGD